MPTENAIRIQTSIEEQRDREIAALSKNDPDYAKKKSDITKRAKQTKYKAMKGLNTQNEKVPKSVLASMKRNKSI